MGEQSRGEGEFSLPAEGAGAFPAVFWHLSAWQGRGSPRPWPSPGPASWDGRRRGQDSSYHTQGVDRCWTLPGNQGSSRCETGTRGPPNSCVSPGLCGYFDSICQGQAGGPSPRHQTR